MAVFFWECHPVYVLLRLELIQQQIPVTFPAHMKWMPRSINHSTRRQNVNCEMQRVIRGRPGCSSERWVPLKKIFWQRGIFLDQSYSLPTSPGDLSFFNVCNEVWGFLFIRYVVSSHTKTLMTQPVGRWMGGWMVTEIVRSLKGHRLYLHKNGKKK